VRVCRRRRRSTCRRRTRGPGGTGAEGSSAMRRRLVHAVGGRARDGRGEDDVHGVAAPIYVATLRCSSTLHELCGGDGLRRPATRARDRIARAHAKNAAARRFFFFFILSYILSVPFSPFRYAAAISFLPSAAAIAAVTAARTHAARIVILCFVYFPRRSFAERAVLFY
jgi:hypothetical protein